METTVPSSRFVAPATVVSLLEFRKNIAKRIIFGRVGASRDVANASGIAGDVGFSMKLGATALLQNHCVTVPADKMTAWSSAARFWQIVRPQDIVWIALFAALAIYGPDLTPEATTVV